MDKVDEASRESFPASDPPAFVAGKDAWAKPSRDEVRARQAVEAPIAMAEYRSKELHERENFARLRAIRLEKEGLTGEDKSQGDLVDGGKRELPEGLKRKRKGPFDRNVGRNEKLEG